MYEEDLIKENFVEVDISKRKFKIKVLNGDEYDKIMDKYIAVSEDGTIRFSLAKRNSEWLKTCVLDAPYEKDGKKFTETNPDEKLKILQNLKPNIRNQLIQKISEVNEAKGDFLKK